MSRLDHWSVLACIALTIGAAGCQNVVTPPSLRNTRSELSERIRLSFHSGVLCKPAAANSESPLARFAPLIITQSNALARLPGFGALTDGTVDPGRRTVYASEGAIKVHGDLHPTFTYLWVYASANGSGGPVEVRGIRIVLNAAGMPVLWETLPQDGRLRVFFVSESLEHAASREYGDRLPGCQSALERSGGAGAHGLVARVIDDGPIPMGPIVYVSENGATITTILCRCMPAQVAEITGTEEYELSPTEQLKDGGQLLSRSDAEDRLELVFRLPRHF